MKLSTRFGSRGHCPGTGILNVTGRKCQPPPQNTDPSDGEKNKELAEPGCLALMPTGSVFGLADSARKLQVMKYSAAAPSPI